MISELKKYVTKTFIKNYALVPIAPLDIRNGVNDPRTFNYSGEKSILINAKTDCGRCFHFMKLDEESNPFVRTLKESAQMNKHDRRDFIFKSLESYYTNYKPASAIERFHLNIADAPDLENEPAWAAPMPWSASSIKAEKKSVVRWLQNDNQEQGQDLDITHGHTYYGPVSHQKLRLETDRFLQVFESIYQNGYKRENTNDGDIIATILVSNDGSWRWTVRKGHHRANSLAALDYELIPVCVKKIVYESEVEYWPNVFSGLYTKKGAFDIFRQFFEGRAF